ncbi:oocyte zinc finger protein XlCOF7.1-like isoform X3 [Pseudophryne corroboree]|uniref:oocyte zinc finger protein XlCOF7.1-like isoform X3 n=1 Tax=Pseudophryne corroboree TaxID=495146 RepID=UPI00308142AF
MEVQVLEHIRHSLLSDRNKDLIIDKLLSLTMEIICLLTREDFIVVRKSGDQVTDINGPPVSDRSSGTQSPNPEAPPHAPTEERSRDRNIQAPTEVYHRETGKVPGKCKDVDVSFSVTEWDYSDGYKDVVMDPPQLRDSVGECSSRSPPGRCETPLYSGDYIKEENRILIEDYQAEPGHGVYHPQCKEEEPVPDPTSSGGCSSRTPADPCETPLYSPGCIEEENRTVTQEYQDEPGHVIYHRQCKEEAVPAEISPGGCNPTHPADPCDTPLYTPGCMGEENRMISQDYQAVPGDGMCYQQCKEEDVPAEIRSGTEAGVELDAGDHRGLQEFLPESSAGPTAPHNSETFYAWTRCPDLTTHQKAHPGCMCGICPSCRQRQTIHQRMQQLKKPFSCSECDRTFAVKSSLIRHHSTHTREKPYCQSECAASISQMAHATNHERGHMKKHVCSRCGKQFTDRLVLLRHLQTHTDSKPYVCSACGKTFKCKAYLTIHVRVHTGEKPYSCSECSKCFSQKNTLIKHRRTHSGEKPFSCSECGKCFSTKSNLYRHKQIHRGHNLFLCSQ